MTVRVDVVRQNALVLHRNGVIYLQINFNARVSKSLRNFEVFSG